MNELSESVCRDAACKVDPDREPGSHSILQVHITERCNLRCTHCYQGKPSCREMSLHQLVHLVDNFVSVCEKADWIPQVNFTGGEPFIREDFLTLLENVALRVPRLRFAVLTNGTLIDAPLARRLGDLGPVFIQVSIEGGRVMHDSIRGQGNFDRCAQALSNLCDVGIPTLVSFTAHRQNYQEFPAVAQFARETGVSRLWTDRLVPLGRGTSLESLSPEETQHFFSIVNDERRQGDPKCATRISMLRALQFLVGGEQPYHCGAGRRLLAVLPDGTVLPCRRLPIPVGNVLETPLEEIYRLAYLPPQIPPACAPCPHVSFCSGGLRCLAHAVKGTLNAADPGCWLPWARLHESAGDRVRIEPHWSANQMVTRRLTRIQRNFEEG